MPGAYDASQRRKTIDAALGRRPSDLVVQGARIVNVYTQEISAGSIAVFEGRIVAVGDLPAGAVGPATAVLDAQGAYVTPGFIEPHFHAADPSLAPQELARALLDRGTTTLVTDLVEFYAVGGVPAVEWALAELQGAGLRVMFLLPLHALGMELFGTLRHVPTVDEFVSMARWSETIGISEPPPNAVLDGDGRVLEVLAAVQHESLVFEGHAPELGGARLQAYLAAGASSDHEATSADDALAKLRLGCRIIMRECAAARDLRQLAPLIVRYPAASRFFMVCSDDMQCKELVEEGHIDHKLRVAMDVGVSATVAVQLATINVAEYFGKADALGSIAPGRLADILLVDSLEDLRPHTVVAGGRVVLRDGASVRSENPSLPPPVSLHPTIDTGGDVGPDDFRVPAPAGHDVVDVRVISITDGSLLSQAATHACHVRNGAVTGDAQADVLKVAALDRHSGSRRIGLAFVKGVGLHSGALASTFNWPHYGLVVVGVDDDEMAAAVRAMRDLAGGLVAIRDGKAVATVAFDVGGIVGSRPLPQMYAELSAFERAAGELGCRLADPVTALAALTIPHIPEYGLSDRGLFEASSASFVDVIKHTAATGR